jgi:tetratricopeptide (TPR) repeat protein
MLSGDNRFNAGGRGSSHQSAEERIQGYLDTSSQEIAKLEFAKAERLILFAIDEADSQLPRTHELRVYTRKAFADLALKQGAPASAEEVLSQAMQIIADSPPTMMRNDLLCGLSLYKADLYNSLGRHQEALPLWTQAMELAHHAPPVCCTAYMGLARTAYIANDKQNYGVFMSLASSQINLAKTPAEQELVITALRLGALQEAQSGRLSEATLIIDGALQHLQTFTLVTPTEIAATKLVAASLFERAGKPQRSLSLRRQVLDYATANKRGNNSDIYSLRLSISRSYLEQGSFEPAEAVLQETLADAKKDNDLPAIVHTSLMFANAYRSYGLYQEAIALIHSIVDTYQTQLDPASKAIFLQTLAVCYADQGDLSTCTHLIDLALEIASHIEGAHAPIVQTTLHANRASVLVVYDQEKAQESWDNLEKLLPQLPAGHEPISSNELKILAARLFRENFELPEVVKALQDEIETLRSEVGAPENLRRADLMLLLARYQRKEDPQEALKTLEEARVLLEGRRCTSAMSYAITLAELAALLPLDDPRRAELVRKSESILNRHRPDDGRASGDTADDYPEGTL